MTLNNSPKDKPFKLWTCLTVAGAIVSMIVLSSFLIVQKKAENIIYEQMDELNIQGTLHLSDYEFGGRGLISFEYGWKQTDLHPLGNLIKVDWSPTRGPSYHFKSGKHTWGYGFGQLQRFYKKIKEDSKPKGP